MSKEQTYKRMRDIPPFISWGSYAVDIPWVQLENSMERYEKEYGIDIDPDFQRGHVWVRAQQIAYVEHSLRGGQSSRILHWNCHDWHEFSGDYPLVLVDGKQRYTAVRLFLQDKLTAFGRKLSQYEDGLSWGNPSFRFHINALTTRAEVLQWYLELNAGGTIHTTIELRKVRALLKKEKGK